MISERELLKWIGEEMDARIAAGERALVPIQLLLTRMSIMSRGANAHLTESTELSLKTFARATLISLLQRLVNDGSIELVDESGTKKELSQEGGYGAKFSEWKGPEYIKLINRDA